MAAFIILKKSKKILVINFTQKRNHSNKNNFGTIKMAMRKYWK